MRRVLIVLAAGAAAVAVTVGAGGEERSYRVDAIFDSTANLIPGQDVKIAGARVGVVRDIELTEDRKARVQMEVEEGFAPFRADAECTIRPQSLIGEKFVQCSPGTPDHAALPMDGDAPTVPLARTHSPVDLDLVFAALRRPYAQRLAIIVNELGTGLAGRSGDLNAAIRRANPALQEANDVLEILGRDRQALARLVEQSDEIVAQLAARRRELRSVIGRADRVGQTVADRRAELAETIDRLPPLLAELEPSADRLAAFASDATPTLRDLRAAAPGVKALVEDFDPLAAAARPALVELASASRVGRRAVKAARPVADRLKPVAAILPPMTKLGAQLSESLRENGAVEHLLLFPFYAAGATARFDQFSHILPSYQIAGSCQQYATEPVPGCSARFGGAEEGSSERRARTEPKRRPRRTRADGPTAPAAPVRAPTATGPARTPAHAPEPPPVTPEDLSAQSILDFLLGP